MVTDKFEYMTSGIVFIVHSESDNTLYDIEFFKDATLELYPFYKNEISDKIAVIEQFKDEVKGIKKEYIDYISAIESYLKKDKIFIVKDINMSLAEFYNVIDDIEGEMGKNLPITHIWYKGNYVHFDLLSQALNQMIDAGEIYIRIGD